MNNWTPSVFFFFFFFFFSKKSNTALAGSRGLGAGGEDAYIVLQTT